VTKENRVFRKTRSGDSDAIMIYHMTLKTKGSMNDVFLPIKVENDIIMDVAYVQSAFPKIKEFLLFLRKKDLDALNLPFFISLMELLRGIIYWVLELDFDNFQNPFTCNGFPIKQR
jgi:hypothetical protein